MIPYMSIGENMYLGNEKGKKMAINWDQTYDEADRYLKTVGLNESSHTLIKDIGVGKQQLVEIAKALAKKARLLILDEPTASLNEDDSKACLLYTSSYLAVTQDAVQAKRGRNVERYREAYERALTLYQYINMRISELNELQFKNNSASYQTMREALRYMEVFNMVILMIVMLDVYKRQIYVC